jgi:hypothetical protein
MALGISDAAMALVKRSSVKHEDKGPYRNDKEPANLKDMKLKPGLDRAKPDKESGLKETGLKEFNPLKATGTIEQHDKAVDYVRAERKKAGLPAEVRKEMADIEEKHVRQSWRVKNKQTSAITSPIDSYLDTWTFDRKIVTANWSDRVAKELVQWINMPREAGKEPAKLTEFFREKGIYHEDFYRLAKQYPILEKAIDYALQALGDFRERNVLENRWNASAGMFMMGHYDKDWQAENERRENAKLKQAAASGTDFKAIITDMLAPVSSTEEVRLRLEELQNKKKD